MDEKSELQQAWEDLQEVPSYFSRFDPRETVHLIVVVRCLKCGNWHNADDPACPVLVEV